MKNLLLVSLVAMSSSAFAQQELKPYDLNVEHSEESNTIAVEYSTIGRNGCASLSTSAISISRPSIRPLKALGTIALTTVSPAPMPGMFCTMALRRISDTVNLSIGANLPALTTGSYELTIDGASYGVLELGLDGTVEFESNAK